MQEQRVGERSQAMAKGHYDFHPLQMVVIAFMIASFAVFLYILIAYLATSRGDHMELSNYFVVSSLLLLLAGQGLRNFRYYFEKERSTHLLSHLILVIVLSCAFLVLQYFGWREIAADKVVPAIGTMSFFYILCIAHAGMVVSALLITIYTTIRCGWKLREPIKRLIFYSNNYEKLKLGLFNQVWFFLQITWIFIYVTFLLTN